MNTVLTAGPMVNHTMNTSQYLFRNFVDGYEVFFIQDAVPQGVPKAPAEHRSLSVFWETYSFNGQCRCF